MLGIHDYNAAGLYGTHSVGFALSDRAQALNADNCIWVAQYSRSSFRLSNGAEPICGSLVPCKRVSALS
jgi:hypothetical protein